MTSLYKINRIIKHKMEVLEKEQTKLYPIIPEYYHNYLNVFLKEVSDTLSLVRSYNYKIELIIRFPTSYYLLYKITLKELEAAK